jgi:UDP-3-O-[3-hydroxymyristoyl] glucosamine N-acyltransferase
VDVPGHDASKRAILWVPDADEAMLRLLEKIQPPAAVHAPGVDAMARVHPSARVAATAHVGPMCVVGEGSVIGDGVVLVSHVAIGRGVTIGAKTCLHPNVSVLDRCVIGESCILWSGVVIGADGFGYRPSARGPMKIPHHGNVVVGNHVEIGANSCVDRGKFGSTTIGDATKVDNLVQIGHNCVIGRGCIICGGSAIGGSVTMGDGVTIAGNCGVADNATMGSGSTLGAKSGLIDNVPEGETYLGLPAIPHRECLRFWAAIPHISDMLRELRRRGDFNIRKIGENDRHSLRSRRQH